MRKRIGRLHGGQLVMLLVPMLLAGFAMMWFGNTYFLPWILGGGVLLWVLTLPILWWWFGARRKEA